MRSRVQKVFAMSALVGVFASLSIATVALTSASAVTGAVSSVSQTVVSDGTPAFDSSAGPGLDMSASNGIVRTHDTFDVRWDYVVSLGGNVTFTSTLTNALWNSASTGSCAEGTAAISANSKTLTCTLTNLTVGSGSYTVRAIADGAAANAATITGTVGSGSAQSSSLALTVSATPKLNISSTDLFVSIANGPGAYSAVSGYNYDVPVVMWSNATGTLDGFSGVKGTEAFNSPIVFDAVPRNSAAVFVSCANGPAGGTRPSYPNGGGGNGTTNLNSVRNAGTWSCAQSAAGAAVSVTVTGADTSLNSYPTFSANNVNIATGGRAYVSVGYVRLWVPKTATTPNANTSLITQIMNFDPTSVSGISNYGSGSATNQPGTTGTCVTGSYANCSTSVVSRIQQNIYPGVNVYSSAGGALPGNSTAFDLNGQVTPNSQFSAQSIASVPTGNESMTNVTTCLKWNPAYSVIDTSKPIQYTSNGLPVTIEYGTTTYSTLSQYQANSCGIVGSPSTNWFPSVAAAGGANAVTAVRITINGAMTAGAGFTLTVPQVANSGLTPGQYLGFFATVSSTELVGANGGFDPATGSGVSGNRVVWIEARTAINVAWDVTGTSAPATRQITLSPALVAGTIARSLQTTVTLPSACFSYVPGSASIVPTTVIAANVGPDGVACTGDDVSAPQLTFSFGDVSASPTPVTLRVNIDTKISTPSTVNVSASVSSISDPLNVSTHSATSSLQVAAVAGFSVAKTADTGRVREGVPFNYTVTWSNTSSTLSGSVKIVDVLPFAGDGRGSTGFASLTLNSATSTTATFEYSTLSSSTALALANSVPDGNDPAFGWTSVRPAQPTAVRIVVANLGTLSSGSATLNVSVRGVQASGSLVNDINAAASFVATPLKASAALAIPTLGTSSIAVTKTAGLSEITASGQSLVWVIHVTNTGQEALSSIAVTDTGFNGTGTAPTVSCPRLVLAANESMDCTTSIYTTRQSDLDTLATIQNSAFATAMPPAGPQVTSTTATATTPVNGVSAMSLSQTPSLTAVSQAGTSVSYTFVATNTGTRSLTSLSFTSGTVDGSGTTSAVSCPSTALSPNAAVTCTATYTVTQSDLDSKTALHLAKTATAIGPGNVTVNSNVTSSTVSLIKSPSLTMTKSASAATFGGVGAPLIFTFTVSNTGNVTLTSLEIVETTFSGHNQLTSVSCSDSTLAPNAQAICTASYSTVQADFDAGSIVNTAHAVATFAESAVSSSASTVTVPAFARTPGVSIATTSDYDSVTESGEVVNYTFAITNTGNVSIHGVVPSVDFFTATGSAPTISCPGTTLAPLASMQCTASYIANQADIDTITAFTLSTSVVAFSPDNTSVQAQSNVVEVEVLPIAHMDIQVIPSLGTATRAGQFITFAIEVLNNGAYTLSSVGTSVAEFNGTGAAPTISCALTTLAPGDSMSCTATYAVTQADIDGLNELNLTVVAIGEIGNTQTQYDTGFSRDLNDSAVIALSPTNALSLAKFASVARASSAGVSISYSFVVTNIGTRTLADVTVAEQSFTGRGLAVTVNCPNLSALAPAASATCTGSYTTVTADLSQAEILNVARAFASNSGGTSSRDAIARVVISSGNSSPTDFSTSALGEKARLATTGPNSSAVLGLALMLCVSGVSAVAAVTLRQRRN